MVRKARVNSSVTVDGGGGGGGGWGATGAAGLGTGAGGSAGPGAGTGGGTGGFVNNVAVSAFTGSTGPAAGAGGGNGVGGNHVTGPDSTEAVGGGKGGSGSGGAARVACSLSRLMTSNRSSRAGWLPGSKSSTCRRPAWAASSLPVTTNVRASFNNSTARCFRNSSRNGSESSNTSSMLW